jgi:hypothetical protein
MSFSALHPRRRAGSVRLNRSAMRIERHLIAATTVAAVTLLVYLCSYFVAAHYTSIGDGAEHYILTYEIRGHSLNRASPLFAPARYFDSRFLRPRYRDASMFIRPDGNPADIVFGTPKRSSENSQSTHPEWQTIYCHDKQTGPNKAAPVNAPVASWFQFAQAWRSSLSLIVKQNYE